MESTESPRKKARTEKTKKRKTRQGPNLWGPEQKKCAWKLFEEKKLNYESIPAKKEIIAICNEHKALKPFIKEKYSQLRVHLNNLASKYALFLEKKGSRRKKGK